MKLQMLLITLAIILTSCGKMGPPPQVKVDEDVNITVPMPVIPEQSPSPAPGIAPLIGFGNAASSPAGINLYAPHPIHIANPSFKDGDSDDPSWKPEFDNFIIGVLTPVVPRSAFKVRWLVNNELVEEDTMQPNSQSWMIGMRWGNAHPGDHVLKVIIDPDNAVAETNENDNTYEVKFSIPD